MTYPSLVLSKINVHLSTVLDLAKKLKETTQNDYTWKMNSKGELRPK